MTIAILLLILALLAVIAYPVLFPQSASDRIHAAQAKALRRHRRQQDRDRKRHIGYWKERGKVIRPLDQKRYCASLDENERVS